MSIAYRLGVQQALTKLGAEEQAQDPSFWQKLTTPPELRTRFSERIIDPMKGELKSMGTGALGGAALGGAAGYLSGKPDGAAMGALLGGMGGGWAGAASKGISNIGTNYTHEKTLGGLNKRLPGASDEERAQVMDEFEQAKALRKQKLDKLFW